MSTTKTSTSVAYCMSDMAPSPDGRIPAGVVSIAEPNGCGRQHRAQVDDDGHPFIRCEVCAPWATGHMHGFANTPAGVPMTPDELGEVEIGKRQGERSYSLAMQGMGEAMAKMLQSQQAPAAVAAPLSLKEQLSGLSAADRAELAAILTTPAATPAEGTDTAPGELGGTGQTAESAPRTASRSRAPRGA
jgi:hypothetical protein